MNCKCGINIPQKRVELGYKECVSCSTVEAHGCIDIIYHKTGNTIQITDKQTAERMRKLSRRSGFGALRGMGSGKADVWKTKIKKEKNPIVVLPFAPNIEVFNKIGEEALVIMEIEGYDTALEFLHKKVKDGTIFPIQFSKIRNILTALTPAKETVKTYNKNWYSKYEPLLEKKDVSEEIINVFKHWK